MSNSSAINSTEAEAASLAALKTFGEQEYPKQVWYLILSAIAFCTLLNVFSIGWRWLRLRRNLPARSFSDPSEESVGSARSTSSLRLPRSVLAAIKIVAFRWEIPIGREHVMSVTEAFITAAYMSALLGWEFANTNNLTPNFWANRAAHIAAIQIPLLPALSSKNNIIGWLTGISHEKINILHRAAARCILVLIFVHFWGRWRIGLVAASGDDLSQFEWERFGATAGFLYILTLVLSIRPIRAKSYEFFYWAHVILVFVFLIIVFLHCSEPGFGYYIWPTWLVWGFDRVLRLSGYLLNNFIHRSPRSTATIELLSSKCFRLTIGDTRMTWRAGQHVFLAFPTVSGFPLESHPFTIASIPGPTTGGNKTNELSFILRSRDGLTKRLRDRAGQNENGISKVPVFVDGPYGAPPIIASYETCVLIAGGAGVSFTLPLLLDIVRRAKGGKTLTRRISFMCANREKAEIIWISNIIAEALESAPNYLLVDIGFYYTSIGDELNEKEAGGVLTKNEDSASSSSIKTPPSGIPSVIVGRPDIPTLLHDTIDVAEGPVSVNVCGPPTMVSAVRSALRTSSVAGLKAVMNGGASVDLHVEQFRF